MVRLNRQQRADLGETLRELANLSAVGLVLSQFVTLQRPSWRLVLAGVLTWFIFVSIALLLRKGR